MQGERLPRDAGVARAAEEVQEHGSADAGLRVLAFRVVLHRPGHPSRGSDPVALATADHRFAEPVAGKAERMQGGV